MMSFDNQSYKDDVCLSMNSSFEEHNTQREDSNTPNFNLIKIDSSELNEIRASLRKIEMYEKLQKLQLQVNQELSNIELIFSQNRPKSNHIADLLEQKKSEVDSRSIYVGNVDYSVTAEELQIFFHNCGIINRVTILCNKFNGHPKGFAYIEFVDKNSVDSAMHMNNYLLRGRLIKVNPKRTNKPGISTTNRPVFRERAVYDGKTVNGEWR